MNKKFLSLLLLICAVVAPQMVSAEQQESKSAWTRSGNVALTFNQVAYSNWASGGENSYGANALFNYSADYKKDKHLWNNRLELAYGLNYTQSAGERKTDDKIYLSSTYGYEIAKNLYVSGLLTFQTQFANGYSYDGDGNATLSSTFMAPGYLTVGGGLTWTPKPWFTATLTPATWREVFVQSSELSYQGAYGVDYGKFSYYEVGANLQMTVDKEIFKNVKLYSRLTLFSDYLDNPQNVDVNWEVQVNMSINKWLSAYVTTNLVYDDNINVTRDDGTSGPCLQFKETFGVGLQYAF